MGEVIVITSGKGGVGKTTTTANIGTGLAKLNKKVVLIDTDIGLRNLDVVMGLENRIVYNIVDVIEENCKLRQALIKDKRYDTLFLLPAAQTRDKTSVTPEQMKKLTAELKEEFDYIILDCPPSLGIVMTSSLVASDGVLIPIQAEFLAMDGLALITGSIERIRTAANPALELNGIVFTMVNSVAKLTQDVINEVRGHFGDKVYETLIPRNIRVSEAPSMGTPVVFLDPRSKGAESYKAFAWEFMAKNPTRFDTAPAKVPSANVEQAGADARQATSDAPANS